MARRVLTLAMLGVVVLVCVALAASESLTNRTGRTATAVTVTFSEQVRITSYDSGIFPTKEPSSRAETFRFSGGQLENGARFSVSWTPSAAEITSSEWQTATASAPAETTGSEGFTTTTDTPTVTGTILNPAYFAHAAYVMQGVSDRDNVFALPLKGVPELAFLPTADGIDPAGATWSFQISHPEGIGAQIAGDTLYIWGENVTWAGYGAVTLTATASGASGSVVIPVTVFRTDKTLIISEGKKDYYVPWAPQLDINRVLSVEEHMRKYNKDEGSLDRTIRWSRWRPMWQLKDVTKSAFWGNELLDPRFPWVSQRALVDVMLEELRGLGVGTIRMQNPYYIRTLGGVSIDPIYDDPQNVGPSMRDDEIEYFVNEAHRLGIGVDLGAVVTVDMDSVGGSFYEIWQAAPTNMDAFWQSYGQLILKMMQMAERLGAEIAAVCDGVEGVGPDTQANRDKTCDALIRIASQSRAVFPGPLVIFAGKAADMFPYPRLMTDAPFWGVVDIIATGIFESWQGPLTASTTPTAEEIAAALTTRIHTYLRPFQSRWNKPYLAYENGTLSIVGAARWAAYAFAHIGGVATVDLDQMRTYYEGQSQAFSRMDGYYGPGWSYYDFSPFQFNGGPCNGNYQPRNKVDSVLRGLFGGTANPNMITVDGSGDEWAASWKLEEKARDTGANAKRDILSISGVRADGRLTFLIEFAGYYPDAGCQLLIDTNGDDGADYRLFCLPSGQTFYGFDQTPPSWYARLQSISMGSHVGEGDIAVIGSSMEVALCERFLMPIGAAVRVKIETPSSAGSAVSAGQNWLTVPSVSQRSP